MTGPLLTSPVSFQLPFLFLYLLLPHQTSLISSNVPCPTLPRIFHMMYPLLRMFFSSQSRFLPSYFLISTDSPLAFKVLLKYYFLIEDSPKPSEQVRNLCSIFSIVYRSFFYNPSPRFTFYLFISLFGCLHALVGFSSLEHMFAEGWGQSPFCLFITICQNLEQWLTLRSHWNHFAARVCGMIKLSPSFSSQLTPQGHGSLCVSWWL